MLLDKEEEMQLMLINIICFFLFNLNSILNLKKKRKYEVYIEGYDTVILAPLERERHPVVTYKAAFSLSGDSVDAGWRAKKKS